MHEAPHLVVALRLLLPLRVIAVDYTGPTLVVIGERWSRALLGVWTWRRDGIVVAGSA